jgi:2-polyprenyl-3-methyl-5-hydroxy-6-metoxy-1,4-benzoquinol methylase
MNAAEKEENPADPFAFLDARVSRFPLSVRAFRALPEIQEGFDDVVSAAQWHGDDFWFDAEERCQEILHLCDGDPQRFTNAVAEWVEFSFEFLLKQCKFIESGHYSIEAFDTIRHDLYDNDEKMRNFYLIALMFSFLFSSNYTGFFAFFRTRMLPRVRGTRAVCDIGCGHGVYLTKMLTAEASAKGIGVDISAGSLDTTRRLLAFRGINASRYRLSQGDVQRKLPIDDSSQDAATCFEVIEHLEHPALAMAELRRILRPEGMLCMSTAIRMESVDHIHLFRSTDDVRRLVEAEGFTIIEDETVPLTTENLSDPEVRERLIRNPNTPLGFVLLAS